MKLKSILSLLAIACLAFNASAEKPSKTDSGIIKSVIIPKAPLTSHDLNATLVGEPYSLSQVQPKHPEMVTLTLISVSRYTQFGVSIPKDSLAQIGDTKLINCTAKVVMKEGGALEISIQGAAGKTLTTFTKDTIGYTDIGSHEKTSKTAAAGSTGVTTKS